MSTPETDDILAEIQALMKAVERIAERVDEILHLLHMERES